MNPYRGLARDVREDSACGWHRAGIDAEPAIDENGHDIAASAVCEADVDLKRARLPYLECSANPAGWTGAALVGTRERLLDSTVFRVGRKTAETVHRRHLPTDRDAIAERLIAESGLSYATWTTVLLGGWAPSYPVDFADRLRIGGSEARSIITERFAAAAFRQTWILVHVSGCRSVAASGATRVLRSLIDAAHAMMVLVDAAIATSRPVSLNAIEERHRLAILLVLRLKGLLDRLDKSVAKLGDNRRSFLNIWIVDARTILEAISRFTVSPGRPIVRCGLAVKLLGEKNADFSVSMRWESEIAVLNAHVNLLDSGGHEPAWPERYRTGAMTILAMTDPSARASRLEAISSGRIYALIMSRRFDRLYQVLPWICAPSAAFPFVFGGPVGAVTQLLELGRTMEVANSLKQRLFDSGDTKRLDVAKGSVAFATAATIKTQVAKRTGAGFRLAETAMSHHMVQAFIAGKPLSGNHPIPVVLAGSLHYDFPASTTDVRTATTICETEMSLDVFATKRRDRDLPTYMGLTVVDLINCSVFEVFGKPDKGSWFGRQRQLAADALAPVARPSSLDDVNGAHRATVFSMLKSLDIGPAAAASSVSRPVSVASSHRTPELKRLIRQIGERLAPGQKQTAQGLRVRAGKLANRHGARVADLRSRVAQSVSWTPAAENGRVDEEPLARVLRGEEALAGSTLVAHCFDAVIWFGPDIDCSLIAWIATGASGNAAPDGMGVDIKAAARAKVAELEVKASDMRLRTNEVSERLVRTLVPIFTGLSTTTADAAHRQGLTWLTKKPAAKVPVVKHDQRMKHDAAAAARRTVAQEQNQGPDGRSLDRSGFAVQSALPGAARFGIDFGTGSRIEGCRTDQRRARRRGR